MFSQEKADAICARLAEGESLRKAAKAEDVAPSTVLHWEDTIPAFAEQYTGARARGYRMLAEDILEISDRSGADTWTDSDGNTRTDSEVVARAKLMVDSRKWMLAKMLPKVFGEKVEHDHKGNLTVTLNSEDASL
jgi:hypothetical protein